jgi:hypothetical protein
MRVPFGRAGLSPSRGALSCLAAVAQLVERRTRNAWVVGSIPTGSTQSHGY